MNRNVASLVGWCVCLLSAVPLQAQSSLDLVKRIWFPSAISASGDTTGGSDVWGYTAPGGEDYAIMGIRDGVAVVRASDMAVIGTVTGPSENDRFYHRDIKTYQHYAYIVSEMTGTNQGLMILDLQTLPDSVRFVGSYAPSSGIRSHNLSIDTARGYAYIVKQDYSGFRIVSLADPEDPVDVGTVPTPDIHDVYARNDTVYVAEGYNSSFSLYDLVDKSDPRLLVRVEVPDGGYLHNIWPTEDGRRVMTTEETTYRTIKMWDVSDLKNVTLTGEYLGPNSLAHNAHIMGDLAFISHYSYGVVAVDISDPANLKEVAFLDTYPTDDNPGFYGCWGAYPFTSNGDVYASNIEGYLTVMRYPDDFSTVRIGDVSVSPGYVVPDSGEVSMVAEIISLDPSFSMTDNLILTAEIRSPDGSPLDDIRLFDDGLHSDGEGADSVFGNVWPVPAEETHYGVHLRAEVIKGDTVVYRRDDAGRFTTVGPVAYDGLTILLPDSVPNPGENLFIFVGLKNHGSMATATDITARLASDDGCLEFLQGGEVAYGDIAPGATSTGGSTYRVEISDSCAGNTDILFELSIASEGYPFWSDSFAVHVVSLDISSGEVVLPRAYALHQNYPNPFNPATELRYELPERAYVEIIVFDLLGRRVRTLTKGVEGPGFKSLAWDASDEDGRRVGAGVYFLRMTARALPEHGPAGKHGAFNRTRKMILMR
ncbi:MAG: choice-of-anchor B family protein [Fidelibacterota bacterium]